MRCDFCALCCACPVHTATGRERSRRTHTPRAECEPGSVLELILRLMRFGLAGATPVLIGRTFR